MITKLAMIATLWLSLALVSYADDICVPPADANFLLARTYADKQVKAQLDAIIDTYKAENTQLKTQLKGCTHENEY